MFSHEGGSRSHRESRLLAGYLAFVGGFSNSAGFVIIGRFTSHVTGNVGRFSNDAVLGKYTSAISALLLILTFFLGSFIGSVILESRVFGRMSRAYAAAMGVEATLLLAFSFVAHRGFDPNELAFDAEAGLLCGAMGLQNGLVTRLSGAVVRTTHLTGVVTDLGIESARWFRYWRGTLARLSNVRLVVGTNEVEHPSREKIELLATIAASFFIGALIGAFGTVRAGHSFILIAPVMIAACASYAFFSRPKHADGYKDDVRISRR